MEKIVLYCKSYRNDFERVKLLNESIKIYNANNIPFFISVPHSDVSLFKELENVNIISDEEIYNTNEKGWNSQQIVKSNFYKLNITENYVCIDSDGYFIKPFYITDFMFDDNIPYTVIHEQKELFSWTVNKANILGFDPKESYLKDRHRIMDVFNRNSKYYDFGPVPTIWSCKVWQDLENNYIKPNNLTWENIINYSPSEFSWYGEALLAFKTIPIYPIEPLFKVFHYIQQYIEYKQQGYTEEHFKQNYLGIIMQSNWNAPLKY